MSDTKIDTLSLEIVSDAKDADSELARLEVALSSLSRTLGSFNANKFSQISTAMRGLSFATQNLTKSINSMNFNKVVSSSDALDMAVNRSVKNLAQQYGIKGVSALEEIRKAILANKDATNEYNKGVETNMVGKSESEIIGIMNDADYAVNSVAKSLQNNITYVQENIDAFAKLDEYIKHTTGKVIIPPEVKAEFGDDFEGMRMSLNNAFVASKNFQGIGLDSWIGDLNSECGGLIDTTQSLAQQFEQVVNFRKIFREGGKNDPNNKGMIELSDITRSVNTEMTNLYESEKAINANPLFSQNTETTQLQLLKDKLIEVKDAVNEKTDAFREEGKTVSEVIGRELGNLNQLKRGINNATAELRSALKDAANIADEAKKASNKISNINENTHAEVKPSADADDVAEKMKEQGKAGGKVAEVIEETGEKSKEASGGVDQLSSSISRLNIVGSGLKALSHNIITLSRGFAKLSYSMAKLSLSLIPGFNKGILGAKKGNDGFNVSLGKALKNVLRYGFGIRSLFVLMNKLRAAMILGFGNLAHYSNETNQDISLLLSGLNQLKNSLATAFDPILRVVTPILNQLIGHLVAASNAVAHFLAAITGASSYKIANRVATDYAASLDSSKKSTDSANKSAEKYKKTLLGFDEINQLNDTSENNSGSGSGGAGDGINYNDMFDTVEVSNEFSDFAERLKQMWRESDFTELGSILGDKLKIGLQNIPWTDIQTIATKIGKSVATFINGGVETSGLGNVIGNTLANLINTGILAVESFSGSLHWNSVGRFIRDSINGALTEIKWENAITAAGNIGNGVAKAINKVMNTRTFGYIGQTIAGALNTVVEYAHSFVTGARWGQWGTAVANGLNTLFADFDWEGAGLTLKGAVDGFVEFISSVARDTDWKAFGSGIRTALTKIEWVSTLSSVLKAVAKIIMDTLAGFCETPGTKLLTAFGVMFASAPLVNKALKFANGVYKLLTGASVTSLWGGAISSSLGKSAGQAATDAVGKVTPVKTALEEVAKKAGEATTSVSLLGQVASGVLSGAALSAIPMLASAFQSIQEYAEGYNGKLSVMGGLLESTNYYLGINAGLTTSQALSLKDVIERYEDGDATLADYAQALSEAGITQDQFKQALNLTTIQMGESGESAKIASEVYALLGETTKNTASSVEQAGFTQETAFARMKEAIREMTLGVDDGTLKYQELMSVFQTTYDQTGSVEQAYSALNEILGQYGFTVADLSTHMGTDLYKAMSNVGSAAEEAGTKVGGASTGIDGVKGSSILAILQTALFGNALKSMGEMAQTAGDNTEGLDGKVATMISGLSNKGADMLSSATTLFENFGLGGIKGLDNKEKDVKNKAKDVANDVTETFQTEWDSHSPSRVAENLGEYWDDGLILGMNNKLSNIKQKATDIGNAVVDELEKLKYPIKTIGSDYMVEMSDGIESASNNIYSAINSVSSELKSSMESLSDKMYSYGSRAIKSFCSGLYSTDIKLPHVSFNTYLTRNATGGFSMQSSSSVSWYAKGGLATGASVVGIGEAGNEAILPLENRKTMSKIADSIANNMSGAGLDEQSLVNAVAQGYAMAIMNQDSRPIIVNAELRTEDNEVLARAVAKGQQSLDFRTNPLTA